MDLTPTEARAGARDPAVRIFGDVAGPDRLKAAGTGSAPELWTAALCAAGLVRAVTGLGLLGPVLLLEEQGQATAQVPYAGVYGLRALTAHGGDEQRGALLPSVEEGSAVVAGVLPAQVVVRATVRGSRRVSAREGARAPARGELTGTVPVVPWLRDAAHVLVADAGRGLWPVPLGRGTAVTPVGLTAPWPAGRLTLDRAPAEPVGGPEAHTDVLATARTAFAGLPAGVCAGSAARAVAHRCPGAARAPAGHPADRPTARRRRPHGHRGDPGDGLRGGLAAARRAAARHARADRRLVGVRGGAEVPARAKPRVGECGRTGRQLDAYPGCGAEVLYELGELIAHGE
ncbi:acyl-CoA dehydrogenase family protein [Streptomyces monashensis]|uniref:acyl-CoA dehydrogenase family protein n=1 Tax=Streptomyces monashensis TaxID=1678012 RepID=UPI0026D890ED